MKDIDFEVVDDFFSPTYFERMQEIILGSAFEWNYRKDITFQGSRTTEVDCLRDYGFNYHLFSDYEGEKTFNECSLSHFIGPAIYMMQDYAGCEQAYRARLDMTVYSGPEPHMHPPHVDMPTKNITSILYLDDSDCPTVIFNEKAVNKDDMDKRERSINSDYLKLKYGEYDLSTLTVKTEVEPKPNRVLFFSGDYIHTGHSPVKHKSRVLLNCNFGPKT